MGERLLTYLIAITLAVPRRKILRRWRTNMSGFYAFELLQLYVLVQRHQYLVIMWEMLHGDQERQKQNIREHLYRHHIILYDTTYRHHIYRASYKLPTHSFPHPQNRNKKEMITFKALPQEK